MRVGQTRLDRFDALDGKYVAGRLVLEFVGAVRRADRDCQRVALRFVDEAGRLIRVGEELVARQLALRAVAILLVATERLQ
jgi:hypothetical protein